jgi:hypothetical protein
MNVANARGAFPLLKVKPRSASVSEPRRGLSLSQQRVYPLITRSSPAHRALIQM